MIRNHRFAMFLGVALMGATLPPKDAPPVKLDLSSAPLKGPADAPIKVAEYADFLCPSCKHVGLALNDYLPHTANRVAIHYKFYPLDGECNPHAAIHPGACLLAYGAVCADEQGKFWPYHDKVYALQEDYRKTAPDKTAVAKVGTDLGLDAKKFATCLAAPSTKERVVADVTEGRKSGVTGTPSLFVNGRRVPQTNAFFETVETESKRLGLGPMPAMK